MKKLKEDEDSFPFASFDKTSALFLSKSFHSAPSSSVARRSLAQVLYILSTNTFTREEATDLFFATTKLWQSKDVGVRQLVYLVIKELSTRSNDVMVKRI